MILEQLKTFLGENIQVDSSLITIENFQVLQPVESYKSKSQIMLQTSRESQIASDAVDRISFFCLTKNTETEIAVSQQEIIENLLFQKMGRLSAIGARVLFVDRLQKYSFYGHTPSHESIFTSEYKIIYDRLST